MSSNKRLAVVVLAAGQGKRMCSPRPKVLHHIAGLPMVSYVLRTAETLRPCHIYIVYSEDQQSFWEQEGFLLEKSHSYSWVKQRHRWGTGHAVKQVLEYFKEDKNILILYGDTPLLQAEDLQQLIDQSVSRGLGFLTYFPEDLQGLGRVIRDQQSGYIQGVVEDKDATDYQRQSREALSGALLTSVLCLRRWLPQLNNMNQQGEYYLTDIVGLAMAEGLNPIGVPVSDPQQARGVNCLGHLAELERYYQHLQTQKLMQQGVRLIDPSRCDVRGHLEVGQDVVVDVNVIFEGHVRLGHRVVVGPHTVLRDVTVGDGTHIKDHSVIEGSHIGPDCVIGPFAHVRPGSLTHRGVKVGNFVELKKTEVGDGSKISHISYLGDTVVGRNVNIGAGCFVCNYNGLEKFKTHIGDHVFVGSHTTLIAPLNIGESATIGAGSVISKHAPKGYLTLSRSPQKFIPHWKRPKKRKHLDNDNRS